MSCGKTLTSKKVPYFLPYELLGLCRDQLAVEHLPTRGFLERHQVR